MPRGNLEVVQPRVLCLAAIAEALQVQTFTARDQPGGAIQTHSLPILSHSLPIQRHSLPILNHALLMPRRAERLAQLLRKCGPAHATTATAISGDQRTIHTLAMRSCLVF